MRAAAGLLGYLSIGPLPERVAEATRRAPWRGAVTTSFVGGGGEICALGSARAARIGHVAVALHGRIDNLEAVSRALGLIGEPDPCAVFATTYTRYGDECAAHLLGDYAGLLLDEQRGILLAVRDWIGTRPLFWGCRGATVAFASEVKQVLALLDQRYELNEAALTAYEQLVAQPLDTTFATGVHAVLPNGHAVARSGQPVTVSRRRVRFEPVDCSLAEAASLVRDRLVTAVSRRTADAHWLGSMLSGGMDSTSVVASASLLARRGVGPPVRVAFTTSYPDVPESDETAYAQAVAEFWSIPWTPVVIRPAEFLHWPEEGFVYHDGPTFPAFRVFASLATAAAEAGVDVLLTGDAGEWREALRWARYKGRRRSPMGVGRQAARTLVRRLRGARAEAYFEAGPAHHSVRWSLEAQEREAARRGIRIEFPFCDIELASLLAGLSPKLRSSPSSTKIVTREAMIGLLPDVVRTRQTWTTLDPVLKAAIGQEEDGQILALVLAQRFAHSWRQRVDTDRR